jgi:hypothetical protein
VTERAVLVDLHLLSLMSVNLLTGLFKSDTSVSMARKQNASGQSHLAAQVPQNLEGHHVKTMALMIDEAEVEGVVEMISMK